MATGDAPAQGPTLTDEVALPDELVEVPRPHPGGQRLALGRGLEERLGLGALERSTGHAPMVARAVARSADQKGATPAASVTTHRPMRKASSEPPISTIRRRSRAT